MREVTINGNKVYQEIKSYEYLPGSFMRVLVGTGKLTNNVFEFDYPQQYTTVYIHNATERRNSFTNELIREAITDLSDLETEYPDGSFSHSDLWNVIDNVLARPTNDY
jgi:hypothetical protein